LSYHNQLHAQHGGSLLGTECNPTSFDFQPLAGREITARIDGGTITSDAGALLLREVEARANVLHRFAECFDDFRDPELIEFSVEELLKQRVFAVCLGYEDLNDHEQLRRDPLLAVLAGRRDPTGQDRIDPRDRGVPLAGKSTLNRLELTPTRTTAKSRYKKIAARHGRIDEFFVDMFLDLTPQRPAEIVLDLDATDDPRHGQQLGRFFHG
jgi:Transposase DDE domain group 1